MTSAWPNLADLLHGPEADAPIGLVGAPLGAGSVTAGRCDLAPMALRAVLRRIGRYEPASDCELSSAIADHGDVTAGAPTIEQATPRLREAVAASVTRHALTLLIGGNNAVTRPGLLGLADALGLPLSRCGLVTLDAHLDMRGLEDGLSNGNPVRALLADGLPGRNIAQIGLAPWANSKAMFDDARSGGHRLVLRAAVADEGPEAVAAGALAALGHCEAILLDCDIDVLDRAAFPAAPGGRAGGLLPTEFFALVRAVVADPRVRVVDLTEWDPPLDPTDLSSLTAGRWLAEVIDAFERRPR